MPLGEIAAAGLSDPGDRQVPPRGAVAFWLGGGGEFGIGGDKHARPLRLARAEPVHQVVQVVMVVSRCHSGSSTAPPIRLPGAARTAGICSHLGVARYRAGDTAVHPSVIEDRFSGRSPLPLHVLPGPGFRWQLQRRAGVAAQATADESGRRGPL